MCAAHCFHSLTVECALPLLLPLAVGLELRFACRSIDTGVARHFAWISPWYLLALLCTLRRLRVTCARHSLDAFARSHDAVAPHRPFPRCLLFSCVQLRWQVLGCRPAAGSVAVVVKKIFVFVPPGEALAKFF